MARFDIPADLEKTQGPRQSRDFDEVLRKQVMEERMQEQASIGAIGGAMQGVARDPLDDLFRYHPPTPEDLPKYAAINQAAKNFAEVLRHNCPDCADFRDAIRKIREARMIANAAVALRGRNL